MVDSLTITFLSGLKKGQSISFNLDEEITIGRGQSNHIVFDGSGDKSVSRQHAIIQNKTPSQDGEWILRDQSTNGTYLNGTKLLNQSFDLNDGDVISFTKDRQDIRLKIKTQDQNVVEEKVNKDETSASFTKIIPTANPGFLKEVTDQPFFLPAICTVLTAIFLFWAPGFTIYTTGLGIYLSLMMLFFVRSVSGLDVPFWLLGGSTIVLIILMNIEIPWILLSLIFKNPALLDFKESDIFLQRFIGQFITVGLLEELFKAIPVFLFIGFKNKFYHLNLPGIYNNGKISPVLLVLIGASSAVGFIIVETLGQYVPNASAISGEVVGLALLIPRFISGIAGHVGFTGIFSYYIGLAYYYKNFNPMLLIIGWVLASMLHGLWNSSQHSIIISSSVAITTFTIFMTYLIKAKKSFPT